MKNGIAILWDAPEIVPECNSQYAQAMIKLISIELVDLNRHFSKIGLHTLKFTVVEIPVDKLNRKADC